MAAISKISWLPFQKSQSWLFIQWEARTTRHRARTITSGWWWFVGFSFGWCSLPVLSNLLPVAPRGGVWQLCLFTTNPNAFRHLWLGLRTAGCRTAYIRFINLFQSYFLRADGEIVKYSNHLITGLVCLSNGIKLSGLWMVQMASDILTFEYWTLVKFRANLCSFEPDCIYHTDPLCAWYWDSHCTARKLKHWPRNKIYKKKKLTVTIWKPNTWIMNSPLDDASMKRRQLTMFDWLFDRLQVRICHL